ncbi:OPT-domain-containing protein [Auriscalpium vulgare]|uniref:OPT-domain-containing protein n=1 Tax=Auriscalpium vulgare TaxID=40419 RepID=A0ACB8S3B4_9AGAM|nr:OPT-domain-containing protein [Auriscalpium vulgare]
MAERPTTSSSSRPYTSAGAPSDNYFPREPQYTYSQDSYIEEEDENSDDGDVFAFLPPSTADAQAALPTQAVISPAPPPAQLAPPPPQPHHGYIPTSLTSPLSPPPPFSPLTSDVPYPSPTFDPGAPHAYFPEAGSSKSQNPSVRVPISGTVESPEPPSTDSQAGTIDRDDGFRLRRLTATASTAQSALSPSTGVSTREVHIAFRDKDLARMASASEGKRRGSALSDASSAMGDADADSQSIKMEFDFDAVEEEDSPFPEVRASVSNIDDPDMPALTLRMWFVGLLLCMTGSALNVFFSLRQPAPTVVPLMLLLVTHPIGKFLAYSVPITVYRLPRWLGSYEFSFNPGPWNIKEHVLVFIMANVSVGPPYALNAIIVAEFYYQIHLDFWFSLVIVLATQMTGFGLAGLCRRFLVWPASMVWPQNLVACALLNTLHAEEDTTSGSISRYRYFMYVFIGSFVWFFLPGYLFTALSAFSWICWIAPNNVPINQVFGVNGLGMSVLTFDWTQITWIGSPLMVPWFAEVHVFVAFVLFYWILTPALYYSNVWSLAHFPMFASVPFDRHGDVYNVTRVLTRQDTFNLTAYEDYSPLYMPAAYAITYLLAFGLSTCVIVHTLLYHGRALLNGFKRVRIEKDDIHAKLMRNYPEVPDWWYALTFVAFFCLAILAQEVWHTGVPVWALLLSIMLPIIYVLPSGFIYAMTGQGITVNILAQIIPGTLLPGNPLANMIFKAYSVQTLTEATSFVQDLKLGHYIKVPPRATFIVQFVATLLAAFLQIGVKTLIFANVPDICEKDQKSHLTCPHNQVFFTASAIWGLIGPSRQFGTSSIYHPQVYAIIAGAVLPIPFWLWQRRYPTSWTKHISTPILLNGVSYIPPATGINYSSWFLVGFVFQYIIRKRNFVWWSKFNYITSAALDSGTVISLIVIFFVLQVPNGGFSVNWWGNTVYMNTADYLGSPLRNTPPDRPLSGS